MIIEAILIVAVTTIIIQSLCISNLFKRVEEIEYVLTTPSEKMEEVKEDLEKIIEVNFSDEDKQG